MLLVFNAFSVFIDLGGTQSAFCLFLSFPLSPDFPLLPTPILLSCSQLFIKWNGEKTAKGTVGCCPNVQEPTGERTKKHYSSSEIDQMWRMFAHFMGHVFCVWMVHCLDNYGWDWCSFEDHHGKRCLTEHPRNVRCTTDKIASLTELTLQPSS